MLEQYGMITRDEVKGASAVLRAAALTYVAALMVSLLQLLRLLMIVGGRRRRH
jgi:Zn-dependent membrane protease YugP